MKTPWILSTAAAVAAAHLLITSAHAVPLPGSAMTAPARADLVRVQAVQSSVAIEDRMARLRQHRSILQSALQSPGSAGPAETLEPRTRALRPEAVIVTAPQVRPVTCEAAARIVADFGFSDIGRPDCSGDPYRFSAMRDGTAYDIGISAATGEIAEVRRQ